ncbi:MAG TPA: Ppx/GppA phosphatase family protein [Kineosporiaceae bacterium]|nr:Ppx/GppA phosphatase family protein [Kineosporiaceae bacterium]
MIRVAAFDCGTNSLRLLVADVDAATGTLLDVDRRMEIVRLGAGVDRTGRISADAMQRAMTVTREYAHLCHHLGVQRYRYIATSAARDADNREEFTDGIQGLLGVVPEVISGGEEAQLSFLGATSGLAEHHEAPYLVVDIGGGSTEFVLGNGHGVIGARSVDIGCVRMTERHLSGDPPTPEQVTAATADIDAALDLAGAEVPLGKARTLVGLAGSVTTVTAHALRLGRYDSAAIHGSVLPVPTVLASCDALLSASLRQRAAMPFLHAGRIDVIGAGALVWRRIVQRVVAEAGLEEVVTSEHDILDGIALRLARG